MALLARASAPGISEPERLAALARLEQMRAARMARAQQLRQQRGLEMMQDWAAATLALSQVQPEEEAEGAPTSSPLPPAQEDFRPALETLAVWRSYRPPALPGVKVEVPRLKPAPGSPPSSQAARAASGEGLKEVAQATLVEIYLDTALAALQAAQTRGWDLSVTKREGRRDVTETIAEEVAQLLAQEGRP